MPSVLIICAHRPDRSPSQRYRFEQYLPFLEAEGYRFTWSYLLSERDDHIFYAHGFFILKFWILLKARIRRIIDSKRFGKFDIVFIQREAWFLGTSIFEKRAFRSGAQVIFDFDDSIWLADTSPGNQKWEWMKRPYKFFDNVKHAHIVIAGNDWLAAKARQVNANTVTIPTTVDTAVHIPKPELRNKETIVIGWSGSISTVKHFELLLPVFGMLGTKYGNRVAFRILGIGNYRRHVPALTAVAWSAQTEVDELNGFDIGVMPLPENEWSLGKCGLKALTYMACEVPVVATGFGANREIISHGENGFLANTPEAWYQHLSALIENETLRRSIGAAGRKTVVQRYSVEANKEKYLRVFDLAARVQSGAK